MCLSSTCREHLGPADVGGLKKAPDVVGLDEQRHGHPLRV